MCETTAVLRRRTLRERWQGIPLLAVCAVVLSACGGDDTGTTQAQPETQTTAQTQTTSQETTSQAETETTGQTGTDEKPQTETDATVSTGSANAVSARRYVSSVCSSVKTWRRQNAIIAKEFQASISAASSAAGVRNSFVAYLDDAIALTDRMAGRVGRAGTPDVEGGAEVAAELKRSMREFRSLLVGLVAEVRELPVEDGAALNRRLQSIGSSLQSRTAALAKTFERLSRSGSPALRRAVTNSPACAGP